MFRSSPARDASTCLRCHVRLALRQTRPNQSQLRHQSTDDAPLVRFYDAPDRQGTRVLRQQRVRGKKGQRSLESAEPLSIKSLGQSSEVIVLRDLPDNAPQEIVRTAREDEEPSESVGVAVPILTARDIQQYSGGKAPRVPPSEVFESLESLKPAYGSNVLSKAEFEKRIAQLAKGYSIGQLRGYFFQKSKSFGSPSDTSSHQAQAQTQLDTTEISTTMSALQNLKRTPWHPGTTRADVRLPMDQGVKRQVQIGRKMNNKQFVVESILRDAWGVTVEEEETKIGEMEFLLTPMQFGLLLTKNSDTLRPLLESSKYYQNSRFQLYRPDHVIRIIGPRAETDAIASVLMGSFAPVRSAEIDLKSAYLLQEHGDDKVLERVFSPRRLDEIMQLTRTYVDYDAESKRLSIASFIDVAINDAHRLLMSLLPLPFRNRTRTLYSSLDGGDCRIEAVTATRNLPFRNKHQVLGRWVVPQHKTNREGSGTREAAVSRDIDTSAPGDQDRDNQQPLLSTDLPIFQQATEYLNTGLEPQEGRAKRDSYWHRQSRVSSWKVRIGHLLHDGCKGTYPDESGNVLSVDDSRSDAVFSPQSPNLFTLLANSNPALKFVAGKEYKKSAPTELLAHLIPSPLEDAGSLASTAFPRMIMRFTIENRHFRGANNPLNTKDTPSTPLDATNQINFRGLRAVLDHEILELNLPSRPIDLRFERSHMLASRYAQNDPQINMFVSALETSMRDDANLRAPPALQLRIPKWAIRTRSKDEVQMPKAERIATEKLWGRVNHGSDEIAVKYLFSGFEYLERRRLDVPGVDGHTLRLDTVEAGVTGGRRVELSFAPNDVDEPSAAQNEALMKASVDLVNLLTRIQRGEVKASVSQKKARETFTMNRFGRGDGGVAGVVQKEGQGEEEVSGAKMSSERRGAEQRDDVSNDEEGKSVEQSSGREQEEKPGSLDAESDREQEHERSTEQEGLSSEAPLQPGEQDLGQSYQRENGLG